MSVCLFFFFFKQKTAYEMRISDWSSDVCSSDLGEDDVQAFDAVDLPLAIGREAVVATEFSTQIVSSPSGHEQRASEWAEARMRYDAGPGIRSEADEIGRESCRERVCQYV